MKSLFSPGRYRGYSLSHLYAALLGNGVSAAASFVAIALVSHKLDPERFGVLSVALALSVTVAGFTDAGLGNTIVRFISAYHSKDGRLAHVIDRFCLETRLYVAVITIAAGFLLARPLSSIVFRSPHSTYYVVLAFAIGAFTTLSAYPILYLQAHQLFERAGIASGVTGTTKLIGVLVLLFSGTLGVRSCLTAFAVALVVSWLTGVWLSPKSPRQPVVGRKEKRAALVQVVGYAKWIMLSYMVTSLICRLDILSVSRYCSKIQVGLYGAALQLNLALPILTNSIAQVLLPKVSRMTSRAEYLRYIRISTRGTAVIALCILVLLPFSRSLISFFLGAKYSNAAPLFVVLAVNSLIHLLGVPTSLVLYSLGKPQIPAGVNALQFVIAVILLPVVTRAYGPMGAACGVLCVGAIGMSAIAAAAFLQLRTVEGLHAQDAEACTVAAHVPPHQFP